MTARIAAVVSLALIVGGCRRDREAEPASEAAGATNADIEARRSGEAMLDRARLCERGGLGAEDGCTRACELGHSNSCARVGEHRFARGDIDGALSWFRRACKGGSGLGCERAADVLSGTSDAAQLERAARRYHRVHCEQGYAPSCTHLAEMFRTGRGGPKDDGAAAYYDQLFRRDGTGGQ